LVRANFTTTGSEAQWTLPDGTTITGAATGYFTAKHEDKLALTTIETNGEGQPAKGPLSMFVFQNGGGSGGGAGSPLPAQINIRLPDGTLFQNVIHVSGTAESMQGLVFEANPPSPDLDWRFAASPVPVKGRGATFAPVLGGEGGNKRLLGFRDSLKRQRIAMIEFVESGKLILGTETGPIDPTAPQSIVPMRDVQGTRDLVSFHRGDEFALFDPDATLTSSTTLEVPDGAVALVNLELGVEGDPDATPDPIEFLPPLTEFTLFMEFDSTVGTPSSDEQAVQKWAQSFRDADNSFQDAKFVVIGRCDDIGTATYNRDLGQKRAEAVRDLLKVAGVPAAKIFVRGEQKTWSEAGQPTGVPIENEIGLDPLEGDDSIDDPNTDGGLG
jgi:outer membrane protein OmpA-like peptidoglycan-associated protein